MILPYTTDPEGNPKSENENVYNINLSNNCGKHLSCTVLDSIGILQLSRFHYNTVFRVLTDILSCVCSQTIAKTFSPIGCQLYANYSCLPLLTRYVNLVKILKINTVYRIFMWGGNQWCGEGQKTVFHTGECTNRENESL